MPHVMMMMRELTCQHVVLSACMSGFNLAVFFLFMCIKLNISFSLLKLLKGFIVEIRMNFVAIQIVCHINQHNDNV
jgi:Rps23 Pro-64 3,4-dihydroxylase Tpa1-like proline 4-hydroxylase